MPRPIPIEEMVNQFKRRHQNSHIIKIDSFSLFKKHQINRIESLDFDIDNHTWKLSLHPNGDENSNAKGYISLYLNIQDSWSMPSNWQVKIHYQLFILNQFQQNWHCKEENVVLNASKTSWGSEKLMPLDKFSDPKQGYLVEDCALIGVKILGINSTKAGTAESFTLVDKFRSNKFTWKILKFSTLEQQPMYESDEFVIGTHKWRIQVYPRGSDKVPTMLQTYMKAEGFVKNTHEAQMYTRYTIRVMDQIYKRHITVTNVDMFPTVPYTYGSMRFMPLKDLRHRSKYMVNDTLYLEAEVSVISQSKYL